MTSSSPNLLFIINPSSRDNKTDWRKEIEVYFKNQSASIELYDLPDPCEHRIIKNLIKQRKPTKVIAVGGDGTIKLIAECIYNTSIPLGIIPAGSANGMAKELSISDDAKTALDIIMEGITRQIHLVKINGGLCIHLSDIGFNAYVVKKFEDENTRGMWGYVKAAWRVLWQHSKMRVKLEMDGESVSIEAAMVAIANGTRYGNGVVINPDGSLFDDLFEVIFIKQISFREIFKMKFTQGDFDDKKTTSYQTRWLTIKSDRKVHFQVDGEYRGRINEVNAEIIPNALYMILPNEEKNRGKNSEL